MTDAAHNENVVPFEQWLSGKPAQPTAAEPIATHPTPRPLGAAGTPYALAALERECAELAAMPPDSGRNHKLNASGYGRIAGFVRSGELDYQHARDSLKAAALASGLTESETEATLKSAFGAAETKGVVRTSPPREDIPPAYVLEETDEHGQPTEAAQEAQSHLNNAIRQRALQLRIDDAAREFYNDWQASQLGQSIPDIQTLQKFLETPDEDATYRITDLWPTGGNVLLAAQYKAGKTSMIANLLRALADEQPFLGKWKAHPAQHITLFDDELDERMLRRWLRDQGIHNTTRIHVVSMKGRLATFNILNARTRARWADLMRGSDLIILDCLRPCLDALGLDEHRDAGKFLVAWDSLKKEAEVSESIVVHHMGHGQERSRGDSRLLDWPDVNWKIVKEAQAEDADQEDTADGGRRFFSAHGRDVSVPEGQLVWEPEGRTLTYRDGGRKAAKTDDAIEHIRAVMRGLPGSETPNSSDLKARLKDDYSVSKGVAEKAIRRAVESGVLIESRGPNNSKLLSLNPSEAR